MSEAPDPLDAAVGARIRMRRTTMGLTQTQLGQALGLSMQQVQKYERGATRVSGRTLLKTAEALDCTVAWLVGEEETTRTLDAHNLRHSSSWTTASCPAPTACWKPMPPSPTPRCERRWSSWSGPWPNRKVGRRTRPTTTSEIYPSGSRLSDWAITLATRARRSRDSSALTATRRTLTL